MTLLFDENLSHRLVSRLNDLFPGSAHVRDLGLVGAADVDIWEAAARGGYVLVSKDVDFYQRAVLHGPPPKVVWLRIGNRPTDEAERALREASSLLAAFAAEADASFLVV